ncbi:sulfatase-like hydrolase/transferase [Planctomycetota bacterium]
MSAEKHSNLIGEVCREVLEKAYESIRRCRKYLKSLGVGVILAAGPLGCDQVGNPPAIAAQNDNPTNIIFILADDLGWTDINCRDDNGNPTPGGQYDSAYYQTPNIAKLRAEAMRFTNAYACPVCSPTRACLMTGQYTARLGMTGFPHWLVSSLANPDERLVAALSKRALPHEVITIAEAFKTNNYTTAHIGKWQLCQGLPSLSPYLNWPSPNAYWPSVPEHGFDYSIHTHGIGNISGRYWEHKGTSSTCWDPIGLQGMAGNAIDNTIWGDPTFGYGDDHNYKIYYPQALNEGANPEKEYLTDSLTVKALDFIDAAVAEANPFFIYLPYTAVHAPHQAKGYKNLQKNPETNEDYVEHFVKTPDPRGLHDNAVYAAMIKSLDEGVGAIMRKLEDKGIDDHTIIVFFSDNGGLIGTGNYPLRSGKGQIYEGGVRVPLIIKWPGITDTNPGQYLTCNVPVTPCDFFPTFLEMAGISLSDVENRYPGFDSNKIDGASLKPLFDHPDGSTFTRKNDPDDPDDLNAIFWHNAFFVGEINNRTAASAVIKDGYKLIKHYDEDYRKYNWSDFDSETLQLKYNAPGKKCELYKLSADGGKFGGALELFGDGDYINAPFSLDPAGGSFSAFAWVKVKDKTAGRTILSQTDTTNSAAAGSEWLKVNDGGHLMTDIDGCNLTDDDHVITNGKWYHVGVVWVDSLNTIYLYIDGDKVAEDNTTLKGGLNPCQGYIHIGATRVPDKYWKGLIDDVRIYKKALSPNDVNNLYRGFNIIGDLAAHWRLDESEGVTVADSSGNDFGGTLRGNPAWYPHDISEQINLYLNSEYRDIAADLKDLLENWLEKVNAKMPMLRVVNKTKIEYPPPGITWKSFVYNSIQDAIDHASDGDTIVVCPGVHAENIVLKSNNITLRSINPDDPEMVAATIIMGNSSGAVVTFNQNNQADCELSGFTITAGYNLTGRGINGVGSSATVSKCIIRNHEVEGESGGGIYDLDGAISQCVITKNSTSHNGGGLARCDGVIESCLIAQNIARRNGGGLNNCNADVMDCTIVGNIAKNGKGGGWRHLDGDNKKITNCIVWGNFDSDSETAAVDEQILDEDGDATGPNVTYSCIQDGTFGGGEPPFGGTSNHNNNDDPKFVNNWRDYDFTIADSQNDNAPNYVLVKVGLSSTIEAGDIIEIDNDGVRRKVKTVNPIGNAKFVTFLPPISPEVKADTLIYKWDSDVDSVIEDYQLPGNFPQNRRGRQ